MAADNVRVMDAVSGAKFVDGHSTLVFVRMKRDLFERPNPAALPVLNAINHATAAAPYFSYFDQIFQPQSISYNSGFTRICFKTATKHAFEIMCNCHFVTS